MSAPRDPCAQPRDAFFSLLSELSRVSGRSLNDLLSDVAEGRLRDAETQAALEVLRACTGVEDALVGAR